MAKDTVYVGMDVHAETIAIAVAEGRGDARSLGIIPNRPEAVRRIIGHLGPRKNLKVCYEAGPTGYSTWRMLAEWGIACTVVAPSLIPKKPGDRIKTDRRDALQLARLHRMGDLTAVWVPSPEHEALRDLVRARLAAKRDQLRHRHRLSKFLLRHGRHRPAGTRAWSQKYLEWVREGWLRPNQKPSVIVDTDALAIVDGNRGFGQVIGEFAAKLGIAKAAKCGIAMIGLRNCGHLGRVGDWAEMAAAEGQVSLHFLNTSGAQRVAPFGGSDRRSLSRMRRSN